MVWLFRLIKILFLAAAGLVLLYQVGVFILVIWYSAYNPSSTAIMEQTLRELRRKSRKQR